MYLLVFASLFIFLLTLNDMMVADFSTTLTRISFFVSATFFILLVVLIFAPLFMIWRRSCVRKELLRQENEQGEEELKEKDEEADKKESSEIEAQRQENIIENESEDFENKDQHWWIFKRIWVTYTFGFKNNCLSQLYFSIFMLKQL